MAVFERKHDLHKPGEDDAFREVPACSTRSANARVKITTARVLHDNAQLLALNDALHVSHDVRVIEPAHHLHLIARVSSSLLVKAAGAHRGTGVSVQSFSVNSGHSISSRVSTCRRLFP